MDKIVGNVHIATRADQLDAEQLREFERSRGWELLTAKVRAMILDAQRDLETKLDHDELMKAQGAVAALRRVLELPGILRAEARPERKIA